MLYERIETELVGGDSWILWQQTRFPSHLYSSAEDEPRIRDLWQSENKHLPNSSIRKLGILGFRFSRHTSD